MRLKLADVSTVKEWGDDLRLHIVMTVRSIPERRQSKKIRRNQPIQSPTEDWAQYVWEGFNFSVKIMSDVPEREAGDEEWSDEWNENWTALKDGSGAVGWAYGQFLLPYDLKFMEIRFDGPLEDAERYWRVKVELPIPVRSQRPRLPKGITVVEPWG